MKREIMTITTPFIKLDSFLKLCGECETGGRAKELVQSGKVSVNGDICLMRGKKLVVGDIVSVFDNSYEVSSGED